jgi:hypothetical protein
MAADRKELGVLGLRSVEKPGKTRKKRYKFAFRVEHFSEMYTD